MLWNSAYRPDEGPCPPHFFNILCMGFVRVAASVGSGIWDVACSSPARHLCGHTLRAYRIRQPCWVCCSLSHFKSILLADLHCFSDNNKKIFCVVTKSKTISNMCAWSDMGKITCVAENHKVVSFTSLRLPAYPTKHFGSNLWNKYHKAKGR